MTYIEAGVCKRGELGPSLRSCPTIIVGDEEVVGGHRSDDERESDEFCEHCGKEECFAFLLSTPYTLLTGQSLYSSKKQKIYLKSHPKIHSRARVRDIQQ